MTRVRAFTLTLGGGDEKESVVVLGSGRVRRRARVPGDADASTDAAPTARQTTGSPCKARRPRRRAAMPANACVYVGVRVFLYFGSVDPAPKRTVSAVTADFDTTAPDTTAPDAGTGALLARRPLARCPCSMASSTPPSGRCDDR